MQAKKTSHAKRKKKKVQENDLNLTYANEKINWSKLKNSP